MATWEALANYIRANYKLFSDDGKTLVLGFNLDSGRHQTVYVMRAGEIAGSEWAEIQTAIGEESKVRLDARGLLRKSAEMVVGGLALSTSSDGSDSIVIMRHSFPLADLDPSEFEGPLQVSVAYGDQLERELTGGDNF
jgi:hypothetical protein